MSLLLVACAAVLALLWWRSPADPLAAGTHAYTRGEWLAAARAARLRLRSDAADARALRLLARSSIRMGREDVAQGIYDRLGTDALEPEDLALLASALLRAGNATGAEALLARALQLDAEHPESLDTQARLLAATDRFEAASQVASRLITTPGWGVRAWVLLAMIRRELSDPAAEAEALEQALALDPRLALASQTPAQARRLLARAYLSQAKPEAARRALLGRPDAGDDSETAWLTSRIELQCGNIDAAISALSRSGVYAGSRLLEPEPAPLAGTEACASCHREIYDAQQSSHHARTFHSGPGLDRLSLPESEIPDRFSEDVRFDFERVGHRTELITRAGGREARALMEFAFGSDDRGSTPVGRDPRGDWREFRLSHYGSGSDWDLTTGHPEFPPGADRDGPAAYLGRRLDADGLRRCFDCHVTHTPSARDGIAPAGRDKAIGCERCHGPGTNHLLAMRVAPRFPEPAIAQPRLASGEQVTHLCARCHSPKTAEVRRDDPVSIRFQGTTLTWSECYARAAGALSCVSCHDPHRDAETSAAYYEDKCLACHDSAQPTPDLAPAPPSADGARPIDLPGSVPRLPCPVNAQEGCIACHMPSRSGVIPHTRFTDHHIRIHREPAPN
jgi:tetratricopeptide (TPR) repeat protein